MTLKRVLAAGIVVTAVATMILTSAIQPAAASGLSRDEAALVAGITGFILGAAAGSPSHPFHRNHPAYEVIYDRESAWERHVGRCYARYRTYDDRTDTFVGFDGNEHFCRL